MQANERLKQLITEFRQILPAEAATARAIDGGEPWEQIAVNAINDGYIEIASELERLIEACLRRNS